MKRQQQNIVSKDKWTEFYNYLLETKTATIETLKHKYDEYEKHKLHLLSKPNAKNYVNELEVLEQILIEKNMFIEEYER